MTKSYEKVLKYWLSEDLESLNSENYEHNPQLWFKTNWNTDQQIKSLFGTCLNDAEQGTLDKEWYVDTKGQVALIIVLDQFSRNLYRGTRDMFKNDDKALKITNELIENKAEFDQLSLIEKYFVYLPMLHIENVELANKFLNFLATLIRTAPVEQKKKFEKYYKPAELHRDLLLKFGRYPHRNLLLERVSSEEELDFLEHSKHTFVRSVLPAKKQLIKLKSSDQNQILKKQKSTLPYQRLLFLHGFRQSSNKLRKRLTSILNKLKDQCNAHVTFLNGTHPYVPNGEVATQMESSMGVNAIMPIESQRIWFNSEDNAQVYKGIDESIDYILTHTRVHGPYDGIIGFGQGATLASIIIAKYPDMFTYLIAISAFQPRSNEHKDLFSEDRPLNFPSLHIYGKNDILITPSRSEILAKCFLNSQIAEHPAGHFAPDSWPHSKLIEFIQTRSEFIAKPQMFLPNQPLEISVIKLEEALLRQDLEDLNVEPLFSSKWAKTLLNSSVYQDYFENAVEKSFDLLLNEFKLVTNENLPDRLLFVHLLLIRSKAKEANCESKDYTYSILRIFIEIYLAEITEKKYTTLSDYCIKENFITELFINLNKWKELILMCDLCFTRAKELIEAGDEDSAKRLSSLYDFLIQSFTTQIFLDLAAVDRRNKSGLLKKLTSIKNLENSNDHENGDDEDKSFLNTSSNEKPSEKVSDLAKFMPRIKSHFDKRSRIARECANIFNPFTHLNPVTNPDAYNVAKIVSYNHYRKVITSICAFLEANNKRYELSSPNSYLSKAKFNRKAMEYLMQAPLSDAILNPVPEPVDVSSHEQMKPLYDWLSSNQLCEADLQFLKGTVTADGRLDLCKQVIGPQGIKPLLDSMGNNRQVSQLLSSLKFGNNVIGDDGGQVIADFIRSGKSPLTVWYIAGNNLTVAGITPICDALKNDTQVNALWLKRNPLKAAGMKPIGDLFRFNNTIQVLDLLNCGLLDEGVKILFDSLEKKNSLKHLYLSANGITPVGLESINSFYKQNKSALETLFLGCNRIGNRGAEMIAEFLKDDKQLIRLNLASSRIGAEGMRSLAESLMTHPTLAVLDLGYTRSTMDLGELGNFMEDEGAMCLGNMIGKTNKLISLSITHNHITQRGMRLLVDAIEFNKSLIHFDYVQFGTSLNEITLSELRGYLERNRMDLKKNQPDFDADAILIPDHVKQMYSVYRTH